jgi:putative flippase GtrA
MTASTSIGRIARFAAVGGLGFALDAGTTEILVAAGAGKLPARVAALAIAVLATFVLNRTITWQSNRAGSAMAAEGGRYAAVALAGAGVNWLVYAALVVALPDLRPALAVAAGSAAAMSFSYLGYARLVFAGTDQAARRPASAP